MSTDDAPPAAVADYLRAHGIDFTVFCNVIVFRPGVGGRSYHYMCMAEDSLVLFVGHKLGHVLPEQRAAVLDVLNRRNEAVMLGNWNLNDRDGSINHHVGLFRDRDDAGPSVAAIDLCIASIMHELQETASALAGIPVDIGTA